MCWRRLRWHDDVIKWKLFPRYWPFVREIHRTKASDTELWFFSLICAWINIWVNNREAGDLRRYWVHYDVTVMIRQRKKKPDNDPHYYGNYYPPLNIKQRFPSSSQISGICGGISEVNIFSFRWLCPKLISSRTSVMIRPCFTDHCSLNGDLVGIRISIYKNVPYSGFSNFLISCLVLIPNNQTHTHTHTSYKYIMHCYLPSYI